jgi:glucosyl-3-phosphoglycerate synthase
MRIATWTVRWRRWAPTSRTTNLGAVQPAADAWFRAATSHWSAWPLAELLAAKAAHRISVVIPARNEEPTIGGIVAGIQRELVEEVPLVDELVVMDSDSTDATGAVARAAGAVVHEVRDVRPELGRHPGKGEALWKSLFVTSGDLLVFIDADLTHWGTHFVSGLLGPLLNTSGVELVKGYYDRILDDGSGRQSVAGGRVTELVARPVLNLNWPELVAVVQPLAGEWAIRRTAFETMSVPVGYGVEIAALLDTHQRTGLAGIAQVDLGARAHVHQGEHDLGVMAAEILLTAARREGRAARIGDAPRLWQFSRDADPPWRERVVPAVQRPAAVTVPGYRAAAS